MSVDLALGSQKLVRLLLSTRTSQITFGSHRLKRHKKRSKLLCMQHKDSNWRKTKGHKPARMSWLKQSTVCQHQISGIPSEDAESDCFSCAGKQRGAVEAVEATLAAPFRCGSFLICFIKHELPSPPRRAVDSMDSPNTKFETEKRKLGLQRNRLTAICRTGEEREESV